MSLPMAQSAPPSDVSQSRRRRALFPPDENSTDTGLGPISPIKFDSDSEDEEYIRLIRKQVDLFTLDRMENGYDIIEMANNLQSTPNSCKNYPNSETMSPLFLSPNVSKDNLSFCLGSPSSQMKTPHELSDNSKIPKLLRKTSVDSILKEMIHSPENKENSLPNPTKNSKVRTALFPDLSKSSKSFCQKIGAKKISLSATNISSNKTIFLCSRKRNSGQINAGVRHRIKKPKIKKINDKSLLLKAALNIMENSPLNDYLNDTQNVSQAEDDLMNEYLNDLKKMQEVPKLIDNVPEKETKKRPHSPDENMQVNKRSAFSPENKKFFKNKQIVDNNPNKSLCDLTSDLAINSPKKSQEKKLFSIFYPGNRVMESEQKQPSPKKVNAAKKIRKTTKDQMLLDAGQKRFGVTQCPECEVIYHIGDPSDEIMHINLHNATHIFRFNGWRNERIVTRINEHMRIIKIVPNDSKAWWKKVKDVMDVVNKDLGFFEISCKIDNSQVFLYIQNRAIVGLLVAEVKKVAYKLLTSSSEHVDRCSREEYPVQCGVSRIWVHRNHRKQGIASALMNSLKRNFVFGKILRNDDIALSSPTELGKIFGTNYFKTPNFLIYCE